MKTQTLKQHRIAICVQKSAPDFMHTGLLEPFALANELLGYEFYEVAVYSDLGEMCARPTDARFNTERVSQIFAGGYQDRWVAEETMVNRLRHSCRTSLRSSFIGSGIFLAELVGLLENNGAAVHGNFRATLEEELYSFNCVEEPLWINGNVYTATGSAAGIRVCLEFIRSDLGEAIYQSIATFMGSQDTKVTSASMDYLRWDCAAHNDRHVIACIQEMKKNIEEPKKIENIAKIVGVSTRQIERKFKAELNSTPVRVYRDLRLSYARGLVQQSKAPLTEVGLASGFANRSTFNRQYKKNFGVSPREDRMVKAVVNFSHSKPKNNSSFTLNGNIS